MTSRTLQKAAPAPPGQPDMPRIPGVGNAPTRARLRIKPLLAVILAALLCATVFGLWLSHRHRTDLKASAPAEAPTSSSPASNASSTKTDTDPNAVATLDELAKPWSSKKFNFVDPKSHNSVAGIVIHLPASGPGESFWAFSLNTPFSRCQLQYETDLSALSQRFAYPAGHPLVVSDCDGILYDPLKMATLPDGSWVRGDIVRGGGIRPPINIQVEVVGRDLVAKRIE
jgi:hypothetical protein